MLVYQITKAQMVRTHKYTDATKNIKFKDIQSKGRSRFTGLEQVVSYLKVK